MIPNDITIVEIAAITEPTVAADQTVQVFEAAVPSNRSGWSPPVFAVGVHDRAGEQNSSQVRGRSQHSPASSRFPPPHSAQLSSARAAVTNIPPPLSPGINGLFLIHQPVLLSITPLHQPPPPPASENLRRNPPCSLMNSTVNVHKLCLHLGLLIGINTVNKARKHQSWLCCWEGIKKKKKPLCHQNILSCDTMMCDYSGGSQTLSTHSCAPL